MTWAQHEFFAPEKQGVHPEMANIHVSYAEMEQAAAQLGQGKEEIEQRLRLMQSQIGGLVSSGFVTEQASKRFEAAYQEYTASANSVVERLGDIQRFLTQAALAIREMDEQIAARIG